MVSGSCEWLLALADGDAGEKPSWSLKDQASRYSFQAVFSVLCPDRAQSGLVVRHWVRLCSKFNNHCRHNVLAFKGRRADMCTLAGDSVRTVEGDTREVEAGLRQRRFCMDERLSKFFREGVTLEKFLRRFHSETLGYIPVERDSLHTNMACFQI